MPNWCSCDLEVSGDKEELEKFQEKAEGENSLLDMNNFVPYPELYRKLDDPEGNSPKEVKEYIKQTLEEFDRQDLLPALEKRFEFIKDDNIQALKSFLFAGFGFNNGGYDWCVNNWGTKWNFSEVYVREEYGDDDESDDPEYGIIYEFETAWAPPIPVIKKMSEDFPDLRFSIKYYEAGMAFQGHNIFRAGEILFSEESDYYGDRGG